MSESARGLRKQSAAPRTVPVGAVFATVGYILRLALHLRRLQPDLVHTNSLKAGVYGSLAARLAGVPMVWHVRDRIALDYLPRPAVWALRIMTRRLTAGVIANSQATSGTLDPRTPSVVIGSPVPEMSAPVLTLDPALSDSIKVVGLVGRLAPWKGQDLFLRAFAEAFPDSGTNCVLVGAALFGEDEYEREIRRLAAELGIATRVEFRGFQVDVATELARMDLLVHASVIPEPFGQVVLQGMAARVPVVAADAGGPAELIRHDVNGVLYPMGDQTALATTMCRLAGDPELRRRLTDGGALTAAHYSPAVLAQRTEQFYQKIILGSRRGVWPTRESVTGRVRAGHGDGSLAQRPRHR